MRGLRIGMFAVMVVGTASAGCGPSDAEAVRADTVGPINDLPNPYERIEPWAELPEGVVSWPAVTGVEPGPDGNIYVLYRCFENSCAGRSEDPIVKFDPAGNPLQSWGAGMFVYPHGFHVDFEGNVWATDADGQDGIGHQVLKFSADGELLMTLGQAGVAGEGPDRINAWP